MKKRYLVVALLIFFMSIVSAKALTVGDCKVLVSFKLNSSLDEEKYICKNTAYGTSGDMIYYSGSGNEIVLNNANLYYFSSYNDYDISLNVNGKNNISLLHLGDSKIKVSGNGYLKFKQNSFVKKVVNGESVYQFVYKDKTILDKNKKIYEGTTLEFENGYELLREENNLPEEMKIEDYNLVQVADYLKMSSVVITESWMNQHIETNLNVSVNDGFGIIEYIEPKEQKEEPKKEIKVETKEEHKLETDNVILISDKKLNKKYELKEEDLREKEVASKVTESIEDKDLVSFYDVSVYNGKKEVSMKNGKYIIKIKIDEAVDKYENFQIIYVNDEGEISEYLDGVIEDGYIVFETSHLSQYGVIAEPVIEEVALSIESPSVNSNINVGNIFKVSLLLGIIIATVSLICFILLKSDLLKKSKRKRKKA